MTDDEFKEQFTKLGESLTEKIDKAMLIIANEFSKVHQEINDFRGETKTHFDSLERRLDSHATALGNHETRIKQIEENSTSEVKTS